MARVHEFFGAEPVIDDRTPCGVSHAGLHRAALLPVCGVTLKMVKSWPSCWMTMPAELCTL